MLKCGAKRVYAVDVGYGQLDWSLRNDGRVTVMERFNARFIDESTFDVTPDFAGVDVSFISLKLILPALKRAGIGEIVTLIKPQFEAGRDKIGKHGVVKDPKVHAEVIKGVFDEVVNIGYSILGLDFSPIKGPSGNTEFIAHYSLSGGQAALDIPGTVEKARLFFDKNE